MSTDDTPTWFASIIQAERWIVAGAAGAYLGNAGLGAPGPNANMRIIALMLLLLLVGGALEYLMRWAEGYAAADVSRN